MSYEGYEQHICKNGHYYECDAYVLFEDDCPVCKSPSAWFNGVDQTNGYVGGDIPYDILVEKFLIKALETKSCPTCHHTESVSPNIFRIPTREETDPLREYVKEESIIEFAYEAGDPV